MTFLGWGARSLYHGHFTSMCDLSACFFPAFLISRTSGLYAGIESRKKKSHKVMHRPRPSNGNWDAFISKLDNNLSTGTYQKVQILEPNGGEIWTTASIHNISWTSEGPVDNVKIDYTIDGGSNWLTITSSIPNDHVFSWYVPDTPSSNCKIRVSDASNGELSDESDSIFSIVPAPRDLYIKSTPVTGIPINIGPTDTNGQGSGCTNTIRTYEYGTTVTLIAPPYSYGRSFLKWVVDNTGFETQSISIDMDKEHTADAIFETEATYYVLTVQSNHGQGASIVVTPDDINGSGDGLTHFERIYYKGTTVTLTAPSTHHQNGKKFSHWKIDGKSQFNTLSVEVFIDGDHKVKAYYREEKSKK